MSDKSVIYGIDLGTTNSCISTVNIGSGKPEVRPNFEGDDTTPSVVYFEKDNPDPIVGREAKRWAIIAPTLVCSHVKRHMGQDEWRFSVGGKQYPAEAISAFILKKVVKDALAYDEIDNKEPKAVVSVPAYFGSEERKATKIAGGLAGIEVLDMVAEPVAAAFAYGYRSSEGTQNVLVYDLGGGTFDATIVQVGKDMAHSIATDGVRTLGGMDWDLEIVSYIRSEFKNEHGVELPKDDHELNQRLVEDSERAKHALSTQLKSAIPVFFEGKSAKVELTLEKFEEITEYLMNQTIERTQAVIDAAAEKGITDIDKILLVGGSSRMKAVKRRVEDEFKMETKLEDPDKAIAKGAALIADLIRKGKYNPASDEELMGGEMAAISYVNSKSIGLQVRDTSRDVLYVDYLLSRNSDLPIEKTKSYRTIYENQDSVDLIVMEQREEESEIPKENSIIHEKPLSLPSGLPKDSTINVTYSLDRQGILHILVEEPRNKKTWEIDIDRNSKISQAEIAELKAELAIN